MRYRKWIMAGAALGVLLLVAAMGLAVLLDVHGIRRGCLSSKPDAGIYETAHDLSLQADGAMSARNYSTANDMLDMALARLGDSYPVGFARDDTGAAVTAGKQAALRNDFQSAALLKRDALGQRLGLFQRRVRLSSICQASFSRFIH